MNQRILHQDTSPAHHEAATSSTAPATGTVRLTTAQALVRYLAAQRVRTEDGTGTEPLFGGVFAIFGHGNS
jgi:3D-(3,5/4)-trihydroxycyclohexane-1,2-dione acylhydrolase (decyclizing)